MTSDIDQLASSCLPQLFLQEVAHAAHLLQLGAPLLHACAVPRKRKKKTAHVYLLVRKRSNN